MADGAREDKEMEHRVHVFLLMEGVEHRTRDVADALGDEPDDGRCRDRVHQRLEGHKDTQSHAHETEGLHVRVLLQPDEADDGARDGTGPDERKETPAPVALFAQCRQRQR